MAKKQSAAPKAGHQIIKPRLGQKLLTLGHLRQAIAGLPDTMTLGPTWHDYAPDHWPQLEFMTLGIEHDGEGGARFVVGVDGHPLNEDEE
jgi:hypothetical protein